jgi:chromosome segregation ATPase
MMRKPSVASLTRQVRSLEQQREASEATIKKLAGQRDEAQAEIVKLTDNVEFLKKQWHAERDDVTTANERANKMELQRDSALKQAAAERERRQQMLADRERERGYIEGLLDRQHPERPELPWEHGEVATISGQPLRFMGIDE